jgi:hypothetical protein
MIRHITGWDRATGSRKEMTTEYGTEKYKTTGQNSGEQESKRRRTRGRDRTRQDKYESTAMEGRTGKEWREGWRIRRDNQERIE